MVEPDRITPENFPPRPVGISLEAYEIMRHLMLSLHGQSPVDEAGDKLVDDYTLQILMGTAVEGQPSARFTGEDGWKDGYVVNKRLRLALLSFYDSPAFGTFRETHPYDREKLTFREAKGSRKTSTWESTSPEAIADAFLEIARKKSTKSDHPRIQR